MFKTNHSSGCVIKMGKFCLDRKWYLATFTARYQLDFLLCLWSRYRVKRWKFWLDKDWRHRLPRVFGEAPCECSQQPSRPIPQQPSVHKGLNCKVLAGGDAGQEQLREEPEGSQLASLAPESLQLVARLQGEEEESALPPSFPLIPLIPPPHIGWGPCQNASNNVEKNTIWKVL